MVCRVRFRPDHIATRLTVIVAVALSAVCLTACSEEVPTDYTAAHRDAFLAACSRPLDDPRLLSDVCACVYDRIEDELPFAEFQRIDERLAGTPAATAGVATDTSSADREVTPSTVEELPVEIARLVADCFTLEADL